MEPQEHIVFRVCDDGVAWYSRLMEPIKEPLQALVGIVSHRVLEPIVSQLFL